MIDGIRCWVADRLFDLAWRLDPRSSDIELEIEIALSKLGVEPCAALLATVADVDHVAARWIYKGLLGGLGLAVAAWGAAWLGAAVLSALGLV
jgi:hypothetical protein